MGNFTDAIRLPSAKFPTVGTVVSGTVLELSTSNVPDFDDKGRPSGLKYQEDGTTPLTQVDVTLDTGENRKITLHTDGAIFWAIGRNLAEIGSEDLEVGDRIEITYTGDGEATAKGRTAPKQYTANITKG